jgi:ATP-dependent RNA helicase DDX49/DBP8
MEDDSATCSTSAPTFESLGLSDTILRNVKHVGFRNASAVQATCIPAILDGKDVIGVANTGSGKTAAFVLPIVDTLSKDPFGIYALCLSPTRELAYQIAEQFQLFSTGMALSCEVIIGGEDLLSQSSSLLKRPNFVVATPGRLMEHLMNTNCTIQCFNKLRCLVLDEADRLLEPSFEAELKYLFAVLPRKRQTLMFSATITSSVLACHSLRKQHTIYFEQASTPRTVANCAQYYCFMPERVKDVYLLYVLRRELKAIPAGRTIVFASTVYKCEMISIMLNALNLHSISLHAVKKQRARRAALHSFKSGVSNILVATDVAARGLDLPSIHAVINYDLPADPRQYIHRVGRTARFTAAGTAVNLVNQYDVAKFKHVENEIGQKLESYTICQEEVVKLIGETFAARRLAKTQMAAPGGFEEACRSKKLRIAR